VYRSSPRSSAGDSFEEFLRLYLDDVARITARR
jgi:hypothetical protein